MPLYDSRAMPDPSPGWTGELAVRIGDSLRRRAAPLGEKLDEVVRLLERSLEGSFPAGRLKASLASALRLLRHHESTREVDGKTAEALEALFLRIREHPEGRQIERYSEYLFTVEIKL